MNPNLQILSDLRLDFLRGRTILETLKKYCREHSNELSHEIAIVLMAHQQCRSMYDFGQKKWTERRLVLNLIWRGLKGESVYENISQLENEIERSSMNEIEVFIERLPIKVLLVVILFHLPALGILGVLPLIHQLSEALN